MSELKDFIVFEKLRVHQLVVEPKRVKATYTVQQLDGREEAHEFIYSYDQVFFDPKAPRDRNLAAMMATQVAINYGLFCKEIEFEGEFEKADKAFLKYAVENTAREIYVNKLLSPNEFLKAPWNQVEARQMPQYSAAKLTFANPEVKLPKDVRPTDPDQYAILSSGGKDSLLTYGLVKELGEAHPVFINESGRHWFTAVNAYKHFEAHEPNTVKPWCNSDRLFNWMLRQMPFIKENYANMRSDMYPIRLWTVSVFLFGVLPVVRKRGIGNVLIGNEYDSTETDSHEGITHYAGLYDQSRYFDNMLTRYYASKGWNLRQYSILRPLGELLILKTLVKRYPDLQRHQVSCHAAHSEEGRMYPCGKCEKCRRIVGMLMALDEDPRRCGYSEQQIKDALHSLEKKSVKQIGTDAAHLYHLLLQKGLVEANDHVRKMAKEYPHITMLRFDKERSLLEDIPDALRKRLHPILAAYATGTAKMENRRWIPQQPGEMDLN